MKELRKLELVCEYCGAFDTLYGDVDALHLAAGVSVEDHWRDHVPSVRYEWSGIEEPDRNPVEEESEVQKLLKLPMGGNDADAATVGEYLGLLLSTLWLQDEGFSGKRPFGNSGWKYEVYSAMGKAGMADIVFDENGYVEHFSHDSMMAADELILQAIKLMYHG